MEKKTITTREEAREYASEWQQWASAKDLSYGEIMDYGMIFLELAEVYDLTEEFKENGII